MIRWHRNFHILSVLRAGVRCCLSVPTFSRRSVTAAVVDFALAAVSPPNTVGENTTTAPAKSNTVAVITHTYDRVLRV